MLDSLRKEVKDMMRGDPAHDFGHISRVYKNAQYICRHEKADEILVLSAVLLHDIVSHPKSSRLSERSAADSAKKAGGILQRYGYTREETGIICDAISQHSFSQNAAPKTMTGKILQDADRLDAIGAIGIARVFATSGSLGRPLYNPRDPFCKTRMPDDKRWALDHFYKKLLKLESMNTRSARMEAKKRTKIIRQYIVQLGQEI